MIKNSSENLINNKCIFLAFSLLNISPNVYAYLDPGTGAMLVQALIAIFIGAGIFFNHIKLKILEFYHSIFQKLKGKDAQKEQVEENEIKEKE